MELLPTKLVGSYLLLAYGSCLHVLTESRNIYPIFMEKENMLKVIFFAVHVFSRILKCSLHGRYPSPRTVPLVFTYFLFV